MTVPVHAEVKAKVKATQPFAARPLLAYLGVRAIDGVENVSGLVYRRVIQSNGDAGVLTVDLSVVESDKTIDVSCAPGLNHTPESLRTLIARLLDTDAPVSSICWVLEKDPLLAPLVAATPGLRIPGTTDPFELAVRAILGQQVSVAAASTLATKLAHAWGTPLRQPSKKLRRTFPTPNQLAEAPLEKIGVTKGRATAIRCLAQSVATGDLEIGAGDVTGATESRLLEISGVGPWTAGYVGLRALGNRNAIPVSDLGLRQALGGHDPWSSRQVVERAEGWRPWRGYGAVHLWSTYLAPPRISPRT